MSTLLKWYNQNEFLGLPLLFLIRWKYTWITALVIKSMCLIPCLWLRHIEKKLRVTKGGAKAVTGKLTLEIGLQNISDPPQYSQLCNTLIAFPHTTSVGVTIFDVMILPRGIHLLFLLLLLSWATQPHVSGNILRWAPQKVVLACYSTGLGVWLLVCVTSQRLVLASKMGALEAIRMMLYVQIIVQLCMLTTQCSSYLLCDLGLVVT